MSSTFPQSIPLGGGGAPAGAGGAAPAAGGSDQAGAEKLVQQAKVLIRQALEKEPDHEDAMQLEDIASRMQKYLATQQKMVDSAMGAGPGTKMVRKSAQQGSGSY